MKRNTTKLTDSYKIVHPSMMQPDTENVYSYGESRIGATYPYSQYFGLQYVLKKHMVGKVVDNDMIAEGEDFAEKHFGYRHYFPTQMWKYVVNKHGGYLPLKIRAVPEGSTIPISNPSISVTLSDENPIIAGLVNHFEPLLTQVWYHTNVTTMGFTLKQRLKELYAKTSDNPFLIPYHIHDFGFRGASCLEAVDIYAMAHLVNFRGTDSIPGIDAAQYYYNTTQMLGNSVAATEHSIKTAFGTIEGEYLITEQLLKQFPDDAIISDVRDSYDIVAAVKHAGTKLKNTIINRKGKYVIRMDSPRFEGDTAKDQVLWLVQQLDHYFGTTTNSKGYKVLHPSVGAIYGDGMSMPDMFDAMDMLIANGYSVESCIYGFGGGLSQKHNRDTQRNAFKSSSQKRNGVWHDIKKNPLDKSKTSKAGRIESFLTPENKVVWGSIDDRDFMSKNYTPLFEDVFLNGELVRDYKFEQVQHNAENMIFI
jgi:nicotinamide phosphoribosyltransferase